MDDGDQVFSQDQSAALVVLEFPSFRDFIDAYSPIIAEDGVFIRDADIAKSNAFTVGDQIDFEVRLKDDFRLIQGKGEVIRLGTDEAAGGASGAAVRFREIDEPSQRLISRLVDNYVRDGGKPFRVGAPAEARGGEVATGSDSQLTAETLKASEAAALFSMEDDGEVLSPVEVESLAPADAGAEPPTAIDDLGESQALEEEGHADPASILDAPVGLETIAIPAGLIPDAPVSDEGTETEDTAPGGPEDLDELPSLDADADLLEPAPTLESLDLPQLDDVGDSVGDSFVETPPGAESVLAAAHGEDDTLDPVVSLEESEAADAASPGPEADDEAFAAAADALGSELGARSAIPEEIAQVAEELSGVHRYEPAGEPGSGVTTYAGAASAKSEPNVGGRVAALVVVFTLLGATAYYFGDTILGWFGLGEADTSPAQVASVLAPETGDEASTGAEPPADGAGAPPAPAAADSPDGGASASPPVQAAPAGGSAPEERPSAPVAEAESAATSESSRPSPPPPAQRVESRKVEKISWRKEGATTVVTISLNTVVSEAYFEVVRVREGTPREVLKIRGVDAPYSPKEIAVGSEHVVRLRTGLHQGQEGSALHVVADLASPAVTILSVEPKGRDLEITFS